MTAIEAYVRELDRATGGSRLRRTPPEIVTEARDHLLDATESWERRGYAREDAERRAIEEFGPVSDLAPSYRSVLALGHVRRMAWVLVVTMMIQPFIWDSGHEEGSAREPVGLLNDAIELFGGTLIVVGLVVAVLCSYGVRWWGVRTSLVRGTAGGMVAGAVLLVVMAFTLACSSGGPTWRDIMLVSVFVLGPMALVAGYSLRSWWQVRTPSALGS